MHFCKKYLAILGMLAFPAIPIYSEDNSEQKAASERISNDGERASNRGDYDGQQSAAIAAERAGSASSAEEAREIEKSYNRGDDYSRDADRQIETDNSSSEED